MPRERTFLLPHLAPATPSSGPHHEAAARSFRSPMMFDAATESPKLALPDVTVSRTSDPGGGGVDAFSFTIPDDPLASVASALVDALGNMGVRGTQRNTLHPGRSFAAVATLRGHVSVGGGNAGGVPANTGLRAYMLDPFGDAEITELHLTRGGGTGLDGGLWFYRVAAAKSLADANDAGGEELAKVTSTSSSVQPVTSFTSNAAAGLTGLRNARWMTGAVSVDAARATVPQGPHDAYVYDLPGKAAAGATVSDTTAFKLGPARASEPGTGMRGFEAPQAVSPLNTGPAGYGFAAGANDVHLLGATNGGPGSGGRKNQACVTGDCNGGAREPPDPNGWNAGTSLNRRRDLLANAAERGIVHLPGVHREDEPVLLLTRRAGAGSRCRTSASGRPVHAAP